MYCSQPTKHLALTRRALPWNFMCEFDKTARVEIANEPQDVGPVEFARPRLTPAWIIRNLNRRNHVPAMLEPTHPIAAPCLNMEDIEHDPPRRTIDGLSHGISVGPLVHQQHGIEIGRASWRERLSQYGEISEVAVTLKKTQT